MRSTISEFYTVPAALLNYICPVLSLQGEQKKKKTIRSGTARGMVDDF